MVRPGWYVGRHRKVVNRRPLLSFEWSENASNVSIRTSRRTSSVYHAGLLRLWRERASGAWRVSLQVAESGERIGFADLECLFAYLLRLTGDAPDQHGTATTMEL